VTVLRRICLLLAIFLLAGAASATNEAASTTRVAVLVPFAEDALARVKGRFEVVAAVRRSLHTPAAAGVVDLGSPHSPSFERLAQARANLIVGDAMIHSAYAGKLETGGAELMLIDASSVDSTLAGLEALGRRVAAGDAMARETAATRARLGELALTSPLATLALFGAPNSFLVLTERTWLGDLMRRLDFQNVVASAKGDERFPGMLSIGDEQLAALRPELVLLVAHGDPTAIREAFQRRLADGGPWRGVRESAKRGVHVLDPKLFATNPGLALPDAARALVELAAPPVAAGAPAR
jgi:ABC-type Fe3+-citrate transport system substrate-binding protein